MCRIALAILLSLVALSRADDPKVPKSAIGPMTAMAHAEKEGKGITVHLRLLDAVYETRTKVVKEIVKEKRVVDGKDVIVDVPVEKVVAYSVAVVRGYRDMKLLGRDVKVQDAAGKKVLNANLPELLPKDTPVLVNTQETVDEFYLLTTRGDTLILTVDAEKVFPTPAPKK